MNSAPSSDDKRILQSKARLRAAFLRLILYTDPAAVTVVELCRSAKVNRSTFYKHYPYIDLFIEELIQQEIRRVCLSEELIINEDATATFEPDHGLDRQVVAAFMQRLEESDLLLHFMRSRNSLQYQKLMLNELIRLTRYHKTEYPDYYTALFQNVGAFATIMEWLSNGKDVPKQHILDVIHDYSKMLFPKDWRGSSADFAK